MEGLHYPPYLIIIKLRGVFRGNPLSPINKIKIQHMGKYLTACKRGGE
jgi:hypothetical protein